MRVLCARSRRDQFTEAFDGGIDAALPHIADHRTLGRLTHHCHAGMGPSPLPVNCPYAFDVHSPKPIFRKSDGVRACDSPISVRESAASVKTAGDNRLSAAANSPEMLALLTISVKIAD